MSDCETSNFTKVRFNSSNEDTKCSGEGAGDIFSGYLLSSSIVYSIVYLSAQASNSSYKVKNCFNTEENYVVCDVYKLNGIGGMSLNQFATKLCFQRGNESVQNSSCKFASLLSGLESGS